MTGEVAPSSENIMRKFDGFRLVLILRTICELENRATGLFESAAVGQGKQLVSPKFLKGVEAVLEASENVARRCEFSSTYDRVWDNGSAFRLEILRGLTYECALNELKVLRESIEADINQHLFVEIKPNKAQDVSDFESGKWLGIICEFPSVQDDIHSAIECYALEQNTACVFHLMRVAEVGLRRLARRMNVSLPKKKSLEWAEWHAILKAMKDKTKKRARKKHGSAADVRLEFYRNALGEFYGFEDAYRNHVVRAHEKYDEYEAASLLVRVHGLMTRLALKRRAIRR